MKKKKDIRAHSLSPLRSISVITEAGPRDFPAEEISAERVGWKAYGLSSLYDEWVPPFFVITSSCLEFCSDNTVNDWVLECLASSGIGSGRQIIIRSSGTTETMLSRGRLKSEPCSPRQIETTIRRLIPQLPHMPGGKVHWIVQEYVNPKRKGQLSNEKRISRENRDWIAEFEPQGDRHGYTVPIAVRRWRDGTDLIDSDLRCSSEPAVTIRLKRVAMWATQLSSRALFEWVWDGKAIHIVQADLAEPAEGVNPPSLLPTRIQTVEPASLQVFHLANQQDYERYGKLRNVKLYGELGYNMPGFYVVDDPEIVHSVLTGRIPSKLADDLAELTKRPLIIRTDGASIPSEKREMLPRSDELRSHSEATDWLCTQFKPKIERRELERGELCLIAHHFIPSVASAWARAEPGKRLVRVESLWGIPEGLYWHSHDTFEVDTQTVDLALGTITAPLKYEFRKRLRYKGTFFAPDEHGRWKPYQAADPYVWRRSITSSKWLFEIAHTTRQVAENEKHAVAVMWFVDNHPQATGHKVLPWFHSKSEFTGKPNAAPRRKSTSAKDFVIKRVDDWDRLKQDLQSTRHIERVVVEPVDQELIRNLKFAEELADLASANNLVVELSGGILSHVYYVLQRGGVRVECMDLFGADEDVDPYNKIVRDKIPALIEARGERTKTVQLVGDALVVALRQKLVEEAFETLDAKSGPDLIGELADLQEVVRALCRALGVSSSAIEAERVKKEKRRGGFEKGLMLIETATPHSIQSQPPTPDLPALELITQHSSDFFISDLAELPAKPLYRRPDLRRVDEQIEKLFAFATEINRIGEIKGTLNFSMPIDDIQGQQGFTLGVELHRIKSSVRGVVRVSLRRPMQRKIPFPK